ncbi:hypothetical protein A3Q56_02446, partial [Intoshia linei]
GVVQLACALNDEAESHVQAAIAWALGQIGSHTPEHAKAVGESNVLLKLLDKYTSPASTEDLQQKCKRSLKSILQKCIHLPLLEPLLHDAPSNILKYVVGQFSKVLPHDAKARKMFVTSEGLKKIQTIKSEPGSLLSEYITSINNCFPIEIVKYYTPGYSDVLLEQVEKYVPP